MKKYYFLMALLTISSYSLSQTYVTSDLSYNNSFLSTDNYSEKDGEVNLKLQFSDLTLKFSSDIKNNNSEYDSSLSMIYKKDIDKKSSVSIESKLDTESGMQFYVDTNSNNTYITHKINNTTTLNFYPFNFENNIGNELKSLDVATVNYFNERYTVINGTTNLPEITTKSLPGVTFNYKLDEMKNITFGIGAIQYDSPVDFDIENATMPTIWQKRVDIAYLASFNYDNEISKFKISYISHNDSEKAHSLLKSSSSIEIEKYFNKFILNIEGLYSENGESPYYLSNGTFAQQVPYEPLYKQSWVNKKDYGAIAKASYEMKNNTPYVKYAYYGENFIYDGENSAHILRTLSTSSNYFNTSDSHGGLQVLTVGNKYTYKNVSIEPYYEYKKAKNNVFSTNDDLTAKEDERVNDLTNTSSSYGIKINVKF
ncbi:MAG: hypothetical protein PWP46_675 [Fusobacteriaceae bacterium]|jgi:hypothetical protein|nr:hypothetical protein [Fusobacteriales bacterium]MDN5303796.1 hypothetical protein [Fusobacteriaceae bacterium]